MVKSPYRSILCIVDENGNALSIVMYVRDGNIISLMS